MWKRDDAAGKVKKGVDAAAKTTKDAANKAGEKVKDAGAAIKKQGR
jgi:hypothetical protein